MVNSDVDTERELWPKSLEFNGGRDYADWAKLDMSRSAAYLPAIVEMSRSIACKCGILYRTMLTMFNSILRILQPLVVTIAIAFMLLNVCVAITNCIVNIDSYALKLAQEKGLF